MLSLSVVSLLTEDPRGEESRFEESGGLTFQSFKVSGSSISGFRQTFKVNASTQHAVPEATCFVQAVALQRLINLKKW